MSRIYLFLFGLLFGCAAMASPYSVYEADVPNDEAPLSPVFVGVRYDNSSFNFATVNHPSFVAGVYSGDWSWEFHYVDVPLVTKAALVPAQNYSATVFEIAPVVHSSLDSDVDFYFKFGLARTREHVSTGGIDTYTFYNTFSPGVGASYQFTRHVSAHLNANFYSLRSPGYNEWLNTYGLGLNYRF